jgi:hypothetical protein
VILTQSTPHYVQKPKTGVMANPAIHITLKEDWRTHGGKRVSSTGLAGGLKRQACNAVHWKKEYIETQAQIDGLPQNVPYDAGGPRFKNPLFGQLVKASAKLHWWTDKVRKSELDMRSGASWVRFDIQTRR